MLDYHVRTFPYPNSGVCIPFKRKVPGRVSRPTGRMDNDSPGGLSGDAMRCLSNSMKIIAYWPKNGSLSKF